MWCPSSMWLMWATDIVECQMPFQALFCLTRNFIGMQVNILIFFCLSTNRCMLRKADNKMCDVAGGNHQCKSGYCKFGRCYTPYSVAMGGTCYVNDVYQGGKCTDMEGLKGRCVCKRDADCEAGKWCGVGLIAPPYLSPALSFQNIIWLSGLFSCALKFIEPV